ncbi:MAG TPA: hypothetical protein ENJ83_01635 [Rhodospirillales bacterium]|nr:hypothetical protein [Rhodospirillales bacterium]
MTEAPGEILAVLAGILVGAIVARIATARLRRLLWPVLSVAAGGGVSWINGEFPLSPEFLLFDVPLVAGVALALVLGLRRLRREAPIF